MRDYTANDYNLIYTKQTYKSWNFCIRIKVEIIFELYSYYYNGLILPLYPVLCCFNRDFYSVSSGSRDISVLPSLFQFFFIYFFFYLFIFSFRSLLLFSFSFSSSLVSFYLSSFYLSSFYLK